MYWITKHLAVGGLSAVALAGRSTAILNLCEDQSYTPTTTKDFYHNGFPDSQPFPLQKVWECVRWIEQEISSGHKVLVHCAEGNSRSVSVAMAYLLYKGHSLDDAREMILTKKSFCTQGGRPTTEPQYFHEEFLTQWQRDLREQNAF